MKMSLFFYLKKNIQNKQEFVTFVNDSVGSPGEE